MNQPAVLASDPLSDEEVSRFYDAIFLLSEELRLWSGPGSAPRPPLFPPRL
jgi:hypothetical protein